MSLLPKSLFGQIVLALLAGLVVAHLAGAWLLLDERARFGEQLRGEYSAQRLAGLINLLDGMNPEERPRVAQALSVPPTRIRLDEPWQARVEQGDAALAFVGRIERELERPLALQVLSIRQAAPREPAPRASRPPHRYDLRERPPRRFTRIALQARLSDGGVVSFRQSLPEPVRDEPLRVLALLGLLALVVAGLSGWAVRRLTRPLAVLAEAADGLAGNLDRAPLAETGPQEVARAARSFNAMQRALQSHLQTRAEALAGVSHDLRLPLTRLGLRLEKLPDADARRAMQADIDEMDAMIGSTLEYLRAGSDGEQSVRLNLLALLEDLLEDAEAAGAKVSLRGTAAPLLARPQALRRCLANLVDNARRYGGGTVDVELEDSATALTIRIADRGPGIAEAERERVFEPYVRLEASRARHTGGTGLGLAIARAVARAHGGELSVTARSGGGSVFQLWLPRKA